MKIKVMLALVVINWCLCGSALELRDPTKPPEEEIPKESVETQVLKVTAIRLNKDGKHSAIINGKIVLLMGWFADAQVVKIEKNLVILKGPKGKIIRLKLWQDKETVIQKSGSDIGATVFPDNKRRRKR